MNNIRYALRLLAKSPSFTLIAVMTLALGIGVNSGIFALVDAVMLRPLPYADPDRLIAVWETVKGSSPDDFNTKNSSNPRQRTTVSPANLQDYKQNRSFTAIAGSDIGSMSLTENGPPEQLDGERVTAEYLPMLGVQPVRGRVFLPEEDRPGNDHVVILSHGLWQRRFGSDPNLVGNAIMLDGEKYQVVGIMPLGFESPEQLQNTRHLEFFVPAAYPAELLKQHGDHEVHVVAHLRPGVTLGQAQAEMDAISARLARQFPKSNANVKTVMAPLGEDVARNVRTSMLVLLGAVGLILLIACVNLANLLLVRAAGRTREISIRIALGASRARVIGELLTQSLVLSALGCAAGLAFGAWTKQILVRLAPPNIPRLDSAGLDSRVLLFTLALSLVTGILFGLFPAWQVSKARPVESLKSNERGVAGSSVMRWRNMLMVAEIAVSMVLLIGAGLLLRSFIALNAVGLGMATEHVLAMNITLPNTHYKTPAQRFAFFDDLATRVSNLPGMQAVTFANRMPLRGGWSTSFTLDSGEEGSADSQAVSPGYFQTLGIPLLRGRLLTPADREGAPPVVVVNQEFVRVIFHGKDVVGKTFGRGPKQPALTIVGVVADVRRGGKAAQLQPEFYLSAAQVGVYPVRLGDFAFRATGDPKALMNAVQQQVWAIDKDQPITGVKTYDELIDQAAAPRRFQALLLLLFAALALVLALVGVYGVISYSVSQRTREMGLRIALGAARPDILRLVIGHAMLLVGAGVLMGAAGAFGLARYLSSLLFEVKPGDPLTYFALAAMLSTVALAACYVPALRATRIDPMVALRDE